MDPAAVAPLAAYLVHEACRASGEVYTAGGGRFGRMFLAETPGYLHSGPVASVEDVAANWDAINDETGYFVPTDPVDWSKRFMSHLFGR